jgi:hypothetical protein
MALVTLLPESPERDNRELDLRQSVIGLLYTTTGFAAPETEDAIQRAAVLAEKTATSSNWSVRSRRESRSLSSRVTYQLLPHLPNRPSSLPFATAVPLFSDARITTSR